MKTDIHGESYNKLIPRGVNERQTDVETVPEEPHGCEGVRKRREKTFDKKTGRLRLNEVPEFDDMLTPFLFRNRCEHSNRNVAQSLGSRSSKQVRN